MAFNILGKYFSTYKNYVYVFYCPLKNRLIKCNKILPHATYNEKMILGVIFRGVISRGAGGALAPPDFWACHRKKKWAPPRIWAAIEKKSEHPQEF